MHQLFILDGKDERMEFRVSIAHEEELIFQVPMHGSLDSRSANPNTLPPQKRGDKSQHKSAVTPQRHNSTWPRTARRHGSSKHTAVIDLMTKRLGQKRHNIRIQLPRQPKLRSIDPDGAILARMIHLQNSRDGQSFPAIHAALAPLMRLLPIPRRLGVHLQRHLQPQRRLGRLLHHVRDHLDGPGDVLFLRLEHQLVVHLQQHPRR